MIREMSSFAQGCDAWLEQSQGDRHATVSIAVARQDRCRVPLSTVKVSKYMRTTLLLACMQPGAHTRRAQIYASTARFVYGPSFAAASPQARIASGLHVGALIPSLTNMD